MFSRDGFAEEVGEDESLLIQGLPFRCPTLKMLRFLYKPDCVEPGHGEIRIFYQGKGFLDAKA